MRRIVDQDLPVLHVGDLACEFHFQVAGYRREVAEISIPLPVVGRSLCRRLLRVRVRHILRRGIRRRSTALRKGFRRVGRNEVRSFDYLPVAVGGLVGTFAAASNPCLGSVSCPVHRGLSTSLGWLKRAKRASSNVCSLMGPTWVFSRGGQRVSFLVDSACRLRWTTRVFPGGQRVSRNLGHWNALPVDN